MANSIAYCLVGESAERFFGLTSAERIERCMAGRGITRSVPLALATAWSGSLVLVRVDHVLDEALIAGLAINPGAVVAMAEGGSAIAIHSAGPADRAAAIDLIKNRPGSGTDSFQHFDPAALAAGGSGTALRKRFNPLILKVSDWSIADIERKLFDASYKGVTDFVTKHVWPWPALRATRWCARHRVTPNQVTTLSALLVVLAFWLFWEGWFAPGLVAAWAMCFLDTLDGKLARVTLTSSKWGNIFDHGIDLVHPPFWYWAWHNGLGAAGAGLEWALWVVIVGYVVGRLQEGWFLWRHKFEIHAWRPIDSWFRQITARRNPNLFILSVASVLGWPGTGLSWVALWTLASLGFHFARIALAQTGQPPRSWLSSEGEAKSA